MGWEFQKIILILILNLIHSSLSWAVDPARWMEEIYFSRSLGNTRLVDVVIPGTHNSGTSPMPYLAPLEPGQPPLFKFVKPIVRGWSRTQLKSLGQQFTDGIRYIDLRIAFDESDVPQVVHGLTAGTLRDALQEILSFVMSHPKEVILIRAPLAYLYNQNLPDETVRAAKLNQAHTEIKNVLGSRLLSFSHGVTFNDFWDANASVMLMDDFDDHWPNAYTLGEVENRLKAAAEGRNLDRFSCLQMIFTPPTDPGLFINPKYLIFLSRGETSLSKFSKPITRSLSRIIKEWHAANYRLNIVSTDFYHKSSFIQDLLNLNPMQPM